MRRTTQWAVFTSMNRQAPAWRSRYEPADSKATTDETPDAGTTSPSVEPEGRAAPAARRDRIDFM